MTRKKETITLSIPPGSKERLEAIARRLEIFWGKSPSVSGLIVAIARGEYELGEPFALTPEQITALGQGMKLLVDAGFVGEAQTLYQLLLDRAHLEPSLRQVLMQSVGSVEQAWRVVVEEHRRNRQPFHLLYRNSQGTEYTYTVRALQIDFNEKRSYLTIWCDETEDITETDFPELIHNRCLRFDRILSIVPIPGYWRDEGLDAIEVQLQFGGWLARAYESKENDVSDEMTDGVRCIVRSVVNPFWLIREVVRYGKDCEIVSPQSVRDRFCEQLHQMLDRYERSNP